MANLVLFAMAREAAHQKSLSGVTRKAFLVSNNGRIYVSHAAEKKEGTAGELPQNEGFTANDGENPWPSRACALSQDLGYYLRFFSKRQEKKCINPKKFCGIFVTIRRQ